MSKRVETPNFPMAFGNRMQSVALMLTSPPSDKWPCFLLAHGEKATRFLGSTSIPCFFLVQVRSTSSCTTSSTRWPSRNGASQVQVTWCGPGLGPTDILPLWQWPRWETAGRSCPVSACRGGKQTRRSEFPNCSSSLCAYFWCVWVWACFVEVRLCAHFVLKGSKVSESRLESLLWDPFLFDSFFGSLLLGVHNTIRMEASCSWRSPCSCLLRAQRRPEIGQGARVFLRLGTDFRGSVEREVKRTTTIFGMTRNEGTCISALGSSAGMLFAADWFTGEGCNAPH